ncbi:MAG TPA: TonB-dependent receptor, partial [Verrucomicrobiae bacterium]|nr:TonB-dependent receptor [Verrucomicrobiae bacterium]
PGRIPQRTAVLNAINIIQWCLYYPGVLDTSELELTAEAQAILQPSLAAYRSGDLLQALALYPHDRTPAANDEQLYLAALLLSAGGVDQAQAILNGLAGPDATDKQAAQADGIRRLIAAVKLQLQSPPAQTNENSATLALAESYVEQSRADLRAALEHARRATELSPSLGFAWTRVAELEFGQGRIRQAKSALAKGLELSPRNAQALALQGFLLTAGGRTGEAIQWFERALAVDAGLANAWLGRGLCRIRQGQVAAGREDLQIAATVEPQRSLLRSYLGKAFDQENDLAHAAGELGLARQFDREDPTPWLYSALLLQQQNRINEAIVDLERSIALNDNRQIYRSRLLLDQDRAVRGVHLANLYRDAGLTDWGARQAVRAVNDDYANYSSHLFLADSYNQLRDPNQINLRYETPWLNEYLLANLLAPVGAGTLSQTVSEQEYSRLFEQDRFGIVSATEYSSRGDWSQAAVQHGTFGRSSYALEGLYQWRNGDRPNNELEQLALDLQFKHQITPNDGLYILVRRDDLTAGDVTPYYQPDFANRQLHVEDLREPTLLAGYHHQWGPGSHSLFLAGRIEDDLQVSNPNQETLWRTTFGAPFAVQTITFDQKYRSELEIYSGEAQHIWQHRQNTLILGGRAQGGEIHTRSRQSNSVPTDVTMSQNVNSDLLRLSVYGYEQWRALPPLLLIAGVSYDRNEFPANYRFAPVTDEEKTVDQISPKAGVIWTPGKQTTLRGGYARGLGGVSLEQSFRLEPSQVAGFNQSFRSLIPESEAGSQASPTFDLWGLALEQQLLGHTYLSFSGEWLESDLKRDFGILELMIPPGFYSPGQTPESLDYRERSVLLAVHQLVSPEWTMGASYRLGYAELERRYPEIPASIATDFDPRQDLTGLLHEVRMAVVYNNAAGFFGSFDAVWFHQENSGYTPERPGDDFWQFNLYAGYRFARRRAEIRLGLLNLSDRDYRLNPLNLVNELPRDRTLTVSLKLNF